MIQHLKTISDILRCHHLTVQMSSYNFLHAFLKMNRFIEISERRAPVTIHREMCKTPEGSFCDTYQREASMIHTRGKLLWCIPGTLCHAYSVEPNDQLM